MHVGHQGTLPATGTVNSTPDRPPMELQDRAPTGNPESTSRKIDPPDGSKHDPNLSLDWPSEPESTPSCPRVVSAQYPKC